MEARHKELLKEKHEYLVSNLTTCLIFLGHLYSKGILNDEEYEEYMEASYPKQIEPDIIEGTSYDSTTLAF